MNLKARKLCYVIDTINTLGGGEIDVLYYKIPTMPLKEGLRELHNDGDVVDMLYHHLHCDMIYIYVEHVDNYEYGDDGVDVDENVDDEECLVGIEHSSDDNDEELVEARRKVKEYRLMVENEFDNEVSYLQKALSDLQFEDVSTFDDDDHLKVDPSSDHQYGKGMGTSQLEVCEPQETQELRYDDQNVDNFGYQTEYYSSD